MVPPHRQSPILPLRTAFATMGWSTSSCCDKTSSSAMAVLSLRHMLDDAAFESDEAARLEKYLDIERYILDNALAIPLLWSPDRTTVWMQPWVNGYNPPKYYGSRYKDVWIDTSHPEYPREDRQ